MAKLVGITVTAPTKDVFSPIKKYEAQLLSTNQALAEQDNGRGEASFHVYHNRKGAYPLVLTAEIDVQGRRHALRAENIDSVKVLILTEKFYRIFNNEQTLAS